MLSAAQVSADEAARVGWVNTAFRSAGALRAHVDQLASRIALFDKGVLKATKASIAEQAPSVEMLADDRSRFDSLAALASTAHNIRDILSKSDNQSKWWEINNNDNAVKALYE
jgi:enoyl-CoA hydratase/carnithine racemase